MFPYSNQTRNVPSGIAGGRGNYASTFRGSRGIFSSSFRGGRGVHSSTFRGGRGVHSSTFRGGRGDSSSRYRGSFLRGTASGAYRGGIVPMNNGASLNNAVGRTGKRPFAALGSPDESDTSPLVTLQKNCTIELRRIPRWLNTVSQLDSYFSKYGKVMNIRIAYQADPEAATVTFEDDTVASVAYKSIVEKGSWCSPDTSGNPNKTRKYCSTKHVYRHMELDKIEDILKRKRELLQGYLEQLRVVTGLAAKSDAVGPDHEQKLDLVKQLTASIEATHEEIALDEVQVATKMFYEMPIDKAISTISDDDAKRQTIDFPAVPPLTESRNVTTSKGTLRSVSVPFKNVDRSKAIPALTDDEDETLTSINIRKDSSGTPGHQPESSEFKRDSDVRVADTGSNNKAPDLGNKIEDPSIIEISDDDDCLEFDYEYPELL